MLGRAVFVLCVVAGTAAACPPSFASPEQEARAYAELQQVLKQQQLAAATTPLDDGVTDTQGVAVALMLMSLCGLAFAITRANAVRRTFATTRRFDEVDLLTLHAVARAQRSRTIGFLLVCTTALFGIASLPLSLEGQVVLVVTPTMLLTIAIIALCRLQFLIGLRPEAFWRGTAHGHYLFVARGKRLVGWVGAPPKLLARASGLPIATVRRG
jgi:hypothetical protein